MGRAVKTRLASLEPFAKGDSSARRDVRSASFSPDAASLSPRRLALIWVSARLFLSGKYINQPMITIFPSKKYIIPSEEYVFSSLIYVFLPKIYVFLRGKYGNHWLIRPKMGDGLKGGKEPEA